MGGKLEKAAGDIAGGLQKVFDEAEARGYFGRGPDTKDPSEYTVSGVLGVKPPTAQAVVDPAPSNKD